MRGTRRTRVLTNLSHNELLGDSAGQIRLPVRLRPKAYRLWMAGSVLISARGISLVVKITRNPIQCQSRCRAQGFNRYIRFFKKIPGPAVQARGITTERRNMPRSTIEPCHTYNKHCTKRLLNKTCFRKIAMFFSTIPEVAPYGTARPTGFPRIL